MRKLRYIVTMSLAVMGVLAVSASAASAAKFHAESSPTYLLGEQQTRNVFTINPGTVEAKTVECNTAKFTGTFSGTELSTLEAIHPEYSGCTAFGLSATVTTTGCNYTLHEPTGSGPYTGTVDVVCESGHVIEVNAGLGTCTVRVGSQANLGSVRYENEGSGSTRDVLLTANVTGISAEVNGVLGTCGPNGVRPGQYTGSVLAKGYSNEKHTTQHGIWVG